MLWRGTADSQISNKIRALLLLTESGLYSLILKSNKPNAVAYRIWVTAEVLLALRKTGLYRVTPSTIGPIQKAAIKLAAAHKIAMILPSLSSPARISSVMLTMLYYAALNSANLGTCRTKSVLPILLQSAPMLIRWWL